jgi:hypothetical protein
VETVSDANTRQQNSDIYMHSLQSLGYSDSQTLSKPILPLGQDRFFKPDTHSEGKVR